MVTVSAVTPVTIPVDPTDATPGAVELHTPPLVAFVNEVVAPVHTTAVPPNAAYTVADDIYSKLGGNAATCLLHRLS